MSFLLVLMLSLTLLIQVELRTADTAKQQLLARQNARLGLMVALGNLQKYAGPDQRVTARADILGTGSYVDQTKHWTGVWDSTNPSKAPAWLVSGINPDPRAALTSQNSILIDLFDPNDVSYGNIALPGVDRRETRVPSISFDVGTYRSSIGFWVEDEGLKASVALPDRWHDLELVEYENNGLNYNQPSTWRRDRARKMAGSVFNIRSDIERLISPSNANIPTHLVNSSNPDPNDRGRTTYRHFEKSTSLSELAMGEIQLPRKYLDFRSPDFTTVNYFTLTNTLDGGVKQDLSHLKRLYDNSAGALPSQAELDALYDSPRWEYLTPEIFKFVNFFKDHRFDPRLPPPVIGPEVPENTSLQPVIHSTAPVLTELVWSAGLGVRSTNSGPTNEVYLYFFVIGELLNPHGFDLATGNGTGAFPGDPSDVQVKITNLPTITITNETTASAPTVIDLSDFVIAAGVNSFNDHAPGYMRPNFAPTSSYRSTISSNTQVGVFAVKIGELDAIPTSVRDDFRVEFGASDVRIELRESNTNRIERASDRQQWGFFLTNEAKPAGVPTFTPNNDPSEGPRTFQTINLRNWGNFDIFYEGGQPGDGDLTRFVRGGTAMKRSGSGGALNDGLVNFGIRMKFVDEWNETLASDYPQQLSQLFQRADLRQPEIEIDMENPLVGDGEFFDVFGPREMDRTEFVRVDDFYKGAEFGSDLQNRIARHYEAPTQEPISIGALNQLHFRGFPAFPLGNLVIDRTAPLLPLGSSTDLATGRLPNRSLHNYFDRYFFSTLPENILDWDQSEPLPNTKIKLAEPSAKMPAAQVRSDLQSPKSAKHLMVEGGLNVNSTSASAWEALLNHRVVDRFVYTRSGTNAERFRQRPAINLERAYYSRSFTGDSNVESGSPSYSFYRESLAVNFGAGIMTKGPHESFIQGVRELSAQQTRELAEAIVREIQAFGTREGRGFTSMTEFLNEGIFQRSIDSVTSINTPGGKPIPVLSPVYFSGGMLLNALSHYLFARSDTFKIKVASEITDPATEIVVGRAGAEATIQRFPQLGNGNLAQSNFKIVDIKWLEN